MGIRRRGGSGDCEPELSACPVKDNSGDGDQIGEMVGGTEGVADELPDDVSSLWAGPINDACNAA